jgi:hypothetical protein
MHTQLSDSSESDGDSSQAEEVPAGVDHEAVEGDDDDGEAMGDDDDIC